jgi:SAM-dependent methyltransferase
VEPQQENVQVVSRDRVSNHGEVYTGEREVNAMLNLVKSETERIDSRFLEPACGNGNFLVEILRRKLRVVDRRYRKSQLEWERYGVLAVCSIYGIDILEDNVEACRERLLDLFRRTYKNRFKTSIREACLEAVRFLLGRNIILGDALTLRCVDDPTKPIVFSEWSPINGSLLKRRDFTFEELLQEPSARGKIHLSDSGRSIFIPSPVADFMPTHFLEVAHVQ